MNVASSLRADSLGEKFLNVSSLQAVAAQVPLEGVLDGEGAGEELVALLVHLGGGVGVEVFVEEIPHVVGEGEDLEVLGVLESGLELLGGRSVVGGLLHDFADETLLALEVVVVELLIDVLEHGDPLDDVEGVEVESISRSGIALLSVLSGLLVVVAVVSAISSIAVAAIAIAGSTEVGAADVDEVSDDSEQDEGADEGDDGGGVGRVEAEESALGSVQLGGGLVELVGGGGDGQRGGEESR